MRTCIKCKTKYAKDKMECPSCGAQYSPGAEKLGYVSFAIVAVLFLVPDILFYQAHGRLPASLDEFGQAFSLLF